ncbi:MAG: cobyrinate a,c-diamide synthase [Desulfobacterales bacterium]|nr:cobyrinate a,c-diamide synthase [Desulfobacterales bacterium]
MVVAGPHSGSGKTTVALGLMAAFKRRGLKVCAFKVGPDFIDPGYHSQICDAVGRNLDGWMLTQGYNRKSFQEHARGSDIAIVEGVMGLFDGYDGKSEAGSTAQMAKWLRLPVLLVVDARSMARSVAALIYGFEHFDQDLDFAGVVFNRVGSPTHLAYLKEAISGNIQMPCLGGLPRESDLALPERHLGLVTSEDNPLSSEYVERLANLVERSIDLEAILATLEDPSRKEAEAIIRQSPPPCPPPLAQTGFSKARACFAEVAPGRASRGRVWVGVSSRYSVRIGVAKDEAFCFYYQDNLEILESFGAELVFFSPLRDERLPGGITGLYLGGGYPELFARRLSDNVSLRGEIRGLAEKDFPIYAECGGFMFLCQGIQDTEGSFYPMAGVYPFTVRMLSRLKSLGYREVRLAASCPLGTVGQVIRGHEFHYSEMIEGPKGVQLAYSIAGRRGKDTHGEGFLMRNTLGSYVHLHFGSNPAVAKNFVRLCWKHR